MNDVPNRSDQDGPRKLATSGRLPRVELVWIGCAGLLNRDFYSTFADRAAAEDVVMVDVGPRILSAIEVRNHWRSDRATQDRRTLMLSALGEGSDQVAPFCHGCRRRHRSNRKLLGALAEPQSFVAMA